MKGADTVSTVWLAAGMVLTSATETRMAEVPLGIGEVMLVTWLAGRTLQQMRRGDLVSNRILRAFATFWGVAFVALLAGALVAGSMGLEAEGGVTHDLPAYVLAAAVGLAYLGSPDLRERAELSVPLLVVFAVVPLGLIAVIDQVAAGVLPFRVWFGPRFVGWAKNPNQTALLLSVTPLFALDVIRHTKKVVMRVLMTGLFATALVIGILTESDALKLSWMAAAGLVALLAWLRAVQGARRRQFWGIVWRLIIPLAVVGGMVLYWGQVTTELQETAEGTYRKSNQGDDRITLWRNGFEAMKVSPIVGLGPGAHSGIRGPFEGSEAHNSVLDWGASAGLVGVAAYLVLVLSMALQARRDPSGLTLVTVGTLFIFSLFHFVLRHPLFWFYMLNVTALAWHRDLIASPRAVARGLSRSPKGRPAPSPGRRTMPYTYEVEKAREDPRFGEAVR